MPISWQSFVKIVTGPPFESMRRRRFWAPRSFSRPCGMIGLSENVDGLVALTAGIADAPRQGVEPGVDVSVDDSLFEDGGRYRSHNLGHYPSIVVQYDAFWACHCVCPFFKQRAAAMRSSALRVDEMQSGV